MFVIELVAFNVKIKVDKKGRVYVSVPDYITGLTGLCGNNDQVANSKYIQFYSREQR